MKRAQILLAGASATALAMACPAAAQTVPEPPSGPPQGTVTTGAGDSAPQGQSGDATSGTTQSATPSQPFPVLGTLLALLALVTLAIKTYVEWRASRLHGQGEVP